MSEESKYIEKIRESVLISDQTVLFGKSDMEHLIKACVEYLKFKGYKTIKPSTNVCNVKTLDELICFFYSRLDSKHPEYINSYRSIIKDRVIAKKFIESRMKASDVNKKEALNECVEIIKAIFEPTFKILMSVPTIAWIPIFLITLGLGNKTVITAIFISSFFSIMYNTMRGIEMVDKNIVHAARTMGLNQFRLFIHVLVPASMVSIINGFRLAIGYAWRALVGGELLAAMIEWGLGKMVYQARYFNNAAIMLVGLLVIGFTGYFLDQIFLITIEKNTVEKWGMSQKKQEL